MLLLKLAKKKCHLNRSPRAPSSSTFAGLVPPRARGFEVMGRPRVPLPRTGLVVWVGFAEMFQVCSVLVRAIVSLRDEVATRNNMEHILSGLMYRSSSSGTTPLLLKYIHGPTLFARSIRVCVRLPALPLRSHNEGDTENARLANVGDPQPFLRLRLVLACTRQRMS